jgi:hypothetical protein
VVGSYECSKGPLGSIKGEFIDHLSNCQLLKSLHHGVINLTVKVSNHLLEITNCLCCVGESVCQVSC